MTNLKVLDLLKEQYNILNNGVDGIWINPKKLDEAIKELEELQSNINSSIEEIEWALAKPDYAEVYLNNALNLLKERM